MKPMKKMFLKSMLVLTVATSIAAASFAQAATEDMASLENQLDELKLPSNTAPAMVSQEKLYSVQDRYSNLKNRFEVTLGGGQNFTGSSFLRMRQAELALRYHFTNRLNLAVSGAYGSNEFTSGAKKLLADDNRLVDAAVVKNRADLLLGWNPFYGKFRLSMDNVLYFDQYIAIGPGIVMSEYPNGAGMGKNTATAIVADIGMAFWVGKNMSFRFGFKNSWFNEKRMTSSSSEHHLLGHLDVGYVFGSGEGT